MEDVKPKEEQIKDEILIAARSLFQRFGLKKTSMEEIADKAGKGKSTLYHYYKNKDEIFASVLDWECNEMMGELKENVYHKSTLKEKLLCLFYCKAKMFETYQVFGDSFKETFFTSLKRFKASIESFEEFQVFLIYQSLEKAKEEGEILPLPEEKQHFMAYMISKFYKGIYMQIIFEDKREEFEENFEKMLDILLEGIRP